MISRTAEHTSYNHRPQTTFTPNQHLEITMSKLPTPMLIQVSQVEILSAPSKAEARPSLTGYEIRIRVARAIYFCKLHNINPSKKKIKALAGVNSDKLNHMFTLDFNWMVHNIYTNSFVPLLATPYKPLYGNMKRGTKPRHVMFLQLFPQTFTFSDIEIINGLRGYRLTGIEVIRLDPLTKTNKVSGLFMIVTAQLLKEDPFNLIHKSVGINKALGLSASIVKLIWAISLRDGKVHHTDEALRYLFHYDKDNKIVHRGENCKSDGLFHRKDGTGTVNSGSYKYMLTRKGEIFIQHIIDRITSLIISESKQTLCAHDFLISPNTLSKLYVRDKIILLSRCAGMIDGKYHIVNMITDNCITRSYSLMTMLTSQSRSLIGFEQIDLAAALQTIVTEVIESKSSYKVADIFPYHFKMVADRKSLRKIISQEIGKDIDWVKKKLSAIDNGGSVSKNYLSKSDTLKGYCLEARPFVDMYLDLENKEVINTAKSLTSVPRDLSAKWVESDIRKGKRFLDGRKVFGLFFHCWTQHERIARELMKEVINGYCHDIHDAIGTKSKFNIEQINQQLKDFGFQYLYAEVS